MPSISLVIILASLRARQLDPTTIVLSLYTLSFPTLRILHRWLGARVSAIALLGLLALTGFLVEVRGGVGPGNILVNAMVPLLGALFFGRRGAAVGLAVVVSLFGLAGLLVLGGHVPPITTPMWDPSGARFWLRGVISFALVGFAVAVTQVYVVERLALEATRLQGLVLHEQLQRQALEAAEREREQERAQRQRAQTALEESRRTEALARMAGGIAHDFNNSLTAIIGAAEEIGQASSLPVAMERAREIVQAALRSAELTRQLLTLGRRQILQARAVSLPSLWERLRSAFRRILPDDIVLDMATPPSNLVAHVDPAELERALFNLVLNARDAMPKGGRLNLTCVDKAIAGHDSSVAPGNYIEVVVGDTGEGISPDVIERVFDPFFTTKPVGAGTGIGLATVHAFARAAGGDLRVTSTPGAGATFTLLLPRSKATSADHEFVAPLVPTAGPQQPMARILVAEDNTIVRGNMVRALGNAGFLVTEAADGDQALARLQERSDYSVLCIDGVMPGVPTREVIGRAEQMSSSLRVLLCSGYLQEELLRRGVEAGHHAFLPKPFSSNELVSAVRGLIAQRGGSPGPGSDHG